MIQIPQSLCSDVTDEQASKAQGGLFVIIDRLEAVRAGADGGAFGSKDDTYLNLDGQRIFGPKGFSTGTSRVVNRGADVGAEGRVQLFDKDGGFRGKDDPLGGFTVTSPTFDGRATVSGSGSIYNVYYKAI